MRVDHATDVGDGYPGILQYRILRHVYFFVKKIDFMPIPDLL